MDFKAYWDARPTGGMHATNCWQGANVKCRCVGGMEWPAVEWTQSHDENRGGRSVTGVPGSTMGDIDQNCNWWHGETSEN